MKKVNDLMIKRSEVLTQYDAIKTDETKLDERKALLDQVETIDAQIDELKRGEKLASKFAEERKVEVRADEKKSLTVAFAEAIKRAVDTGTNVTFNPFEFRADPIATTTDTDLITKMAGASLSVMKTPGKDFALNLGVQIATGLTGNFPLPAMGEITGSGPNEGVDVSTANAAPGAILLTGKRNGTSQKFNKEFLLQASPEILQGVINSMVDACYLKELYNLMDNLQVDAVDASTTIAGSTLALVDVVNLEAGVPFAKTSPAFVTTPAVAGFLKKTAGLTNQAAMWTGKIEGGELDGYAGYGHSAVNTKNLVFGDWNKAYIGVWQEPQILINPYTYAKAGQVEIVVDSVMDSGIADYRAFKWINDVSI